MKTNLKQKLALITSFEDYEKYKSDIEEDLARLIIHKHHLKEAPLLLFPEGTNIVYSFGDAVIKIFPPFHQNQFESEGLVLKKLAGKLRIKTPELKYEGEIFGWPYLIISKLEGTNLETLWETMPHANKKIIIRELGALIREVHSLPIKGLESLDCNWPKFIEKQLQNCVAQHQTKGLAATLINQIPNYLKSVKEFLPRLKKPVLLTGEYTPMNFLVIQEEGIWHICGLIDFGDCMLGLPLYDLLGPGAFLIQGDKLLLRAFLEAYGLSSMELTTTLSKILTTLMLLHQYSNLNVQIRIPDWQEQVKSFQDLENLVWGF